MRIILLGAPGAGKGTQAEILSEKLGVPVIGTGAIIREAIRSGSSLGMRFKEYTDKGHLAPDQLVVEMVSDRLSSPDCQNGYILDGFPRTIVQAEEFERMGGEVDSVIILKVEDSAIVRRMTGRRVCSQCGAPFHTVHHPPKKEDVCDFCGGELIRRSDDQPETVGERLSVYHEQTEPLIAYYRERGKLSEVDAMQSVDAVTRQALEILERRKW